MKSKKQLALACPFDNIRASARPMVAFSGFYESHKPPPSGDVRGIVPLHRDGHRNSHQSGYMLHRCIVCCRPGGLRDNTERLVTRWRRPVASGVALDMLHWEMLQLLLQGAAFVCHRRLFCLA